MRGGGNVYITVEWLGGESRTFTIPPGRKGANTSWGWRVTMLEGVPFLIIRSKEGLRFEFPLQAVKFIQVDATERVVDRHGSDPGRPGGSGPPGDVAGDADESSSTPGRFSVLPSEQNIAWDLPGRIKPFEPSPQSRPSDNRDRPVPRPSQRTTVVLTRNGPVTYHYPDCDVAQAAIGGVEAANCLCDFRDRHKD